MARDPFSSSFYLGQNGQKSTENYMNHQASDVEVMGESFISIHAYSLKLGNVLFVIVTNFVLIEV